MLFVHKDCQGQGIAKIILQKLRRARESFENPDVLKAVDWAISRLADSPVTNGNAST